MPDLKPLLTSIRTVAIIGCSPRPARTSHKIARYLQQTAGYEIFPVNPHAEEILGVPSAPRVQDVPKEVSLDVVDIFRASQHTAAMVRDVIKRVEQTGEQPVIWTQIGVSSPEAEALAEEAGLRYVRNRCLMVEHNRLF